MKVTDAEAMRLMRKPDVVFDQEREDRISKERGRNSLAMTLEKSLADLNRQRDAWRLFEAQRYGANGVKLDPVLASHLHVS